MKKTPITRERLQELLNLNHATGTFTWKESVNHKEGDKCESTSSHGYRIVTLDKRQYYCHRLTWLWNCGYYPHSFWCIDHISGERTNNRFPNLRMVTRAMNRENLSKACKNNLSSGLLGVSRYKPNGKYVARINHAKKQYNLGSFNTAEEAHAAYVAKKQELHNFGEI